MYSCRITPDFCFLSVPTSLDEFNKKPRMVIEHFLGDMPERTDDLASQCLLFAVDAYGNFSLEIVVKPKHGNIERDIAGKVAIKLHIAIKADTTNYPVAGAGIFPKRVAKLTYFAMCYSLSAMAPVQAVLIGNATVLFVKNR